MAVSRRSSNFGCSCNQGGGQAGSHPGQRLVAQGWWGTEAGHGRCLDQLFGDRPSIELLKAAKPHGRCGRPVFFKLVSQKRFDVVVSEQKEIPVVGVLRQEPGRFEIATNGFGAAVARSEAAGEGPQEGIVACLSTGHAAK